MADEKKSYEIEIRFTSESATAEEMRELELELERRGHRVRLRRPQFGSVVSDLTRSARDFAQFAGSAAETGLNMLRSAIEPIVGSGDKDKKVENKPASFDEIGPGAAHHETADRAIIVTSPELLDSDLTSNTITLGLLPKTALDRSWQALSFDAIVIPHSAFKPYLEQVSWKNEQIFEGGYLAAPQNRTAMTHDEALKHFGLASDAGPVLLVMANGIARSDLENVILQISLQRTPYQLFLYHGNDMDKADHLRMLAQRYGVKGRMFGRCSTMADYAAMADLVIADTQDSESLEWIENAGTPSIVITNHRATARVSFLAHTHAAAIASDVLNLSAALTVPLQDAAVRLTMKQAAMDVAAHASTVKCADAIEAALKASTAKPRVPSVREAGAGGFEEIGQGTASFQPVTPIGSDASATLQPVQPSASPAQPSVTMPPAQPSVTMPPAQPSVTMPPAQPSVTMPPAQPISPILTPNLNIMSLQDIQRNYAALVASEKHIDKALNEASAQVRIWEQNLDLARQNSREDLAASAQARLAAAQQQEKILFQQKDEISQQKAVLKQEAYTARANRNVPSSAFRFDQDDDPDLVSGDIFGPTEEEKRTNAEFEKIKRQAALDDLKNRMGK